MALATLSAIESTQFGSYLLDAGLIEWDQLEAALEYQRHRPFLHLGEVLCLMGVLKEYDLPELLRRYTRKARLGHVLLAKGSVTMPQLMEALERQADGRRPLGELLVELGYLTGEELASALHGHEGTNEPSADLFAKIHTDRQVNFFTRAMARDRYPYFQPLEGPEAPDTRLHGKDILLLAGNSYLGLSDDPVVKEASIEAIRRYGVGTSGSPMLNGTMDLHVALEGQLSAFMEQEACALFSTGFQTNLGALSCLAGRGDVVIVDAAAHASIHDGCRLGFGDVKRFHHNDMGHLERLLRAAGKRGKLIVVDGVYSMDGDLADLPTIVKLAKAYQAKVLVDDAHGFGVLGMRGRGTVEYFGLLDEVDLIMLTFSKSLGTVGGCLLGKREVIHYVKHRSRPFIFSASLPPGTVAATAAALEQLRSGDALRRQLERNVRTMRRGLMELGYSLGASHSHILPVHVGDDELALQLGCELLNEGVLVGTVVSPGVPPGHSRLRVSLMASHTEAQLERGLAAFERVGVRLGVLHQPIKKGERMFELDVLPQGTVTELVLRGDLDTAASIDLDARLETLVPTLEGELNVDLSGLTYLNSTGVRSFIRLDKLLKAHGGSFTLKGVPARIFRIFSYCGLDTYFRFERAPDPDLAKDGTLSKVIKADTADALTARKDA
jgi:8-amino-7-oxononanoate synthase